MTAFTILAMFLTKVVIADISHLLVLGRVGVDHVVDVEGLAGQDNVFCLGQFRLV